MKILILGNGAREHALSWAFSKSRRNTGLFCMPGNVGTADIAINIAGDPADPAAVVGVALEQAVDLVVIGPELPLAAGVADDLRAAGFAVFGPGAAAARLESSKAFARTFSDEAGIPSARTMRFRTFEDFSRWLSATRDIPAQYPAFNGRIVLKKSGLAAGKGVLESADITELLDFARRVLAEDELLVEEYLEGYELSVFALCDGDAYLTLPACADHKKALPGNQGPNTGGMGAICPVPGADKTLMERIDHDIIAPTFRHISATGLGFRGVLFFGIMVTPTGPRLLEYNVRFGDPETQSLFALLASDPCDLVNSVARGQLANLRLHFKDGSAVGITVAAPGYPGLYPRDLAVRGLPRDGRNLLVFHAGTHRDQDDCIRTTGGRCFTVVGIGNDFFAAHARAVAGALAVDFDGAWFRPDIGQKYYMD
jgi:phosphoribosylamine--glycine ligase